MVWAGIWQNGRTAAVVIRGTLNAERYKNEIVLPIVIPTVRDNHLIFQDDNATPHRAGIVRSAVRDWNPHPALASAITGFGTH